MNHFKNLTASLDDVNKVQLTRRPWRMLVGLGLRGRCVVIFDDGKLCPCKERIKHMNYESDFVLYEKAE